MSFDEEPLDEHYKCEREVAELEARIEALEAALRWAAGTGDLRDWALYAPKDIAVTIEAFNPDGGRLAALAAAETLPDAAPGQCRHCGQFVNANGVPVGPHDCTSVDLGGEPT